MKAHVTMNDLQQNRETGAGGGLGGGDFYYPLSFVQGLLQNNPHHPIQTERNVTRGRDLCERERGTANESEGEVFLA